MKLTSRFAILAVAFSTPLVSANEIFDELRALPAGWSFSRPANPGQSFHHSFEKVTLTRAADVLKLRISVKQQNVPALEQIVLDISTPGHPSYGNHMST
jgi:tripeptidyl-peptidase-1